MAEILLVGIDPDLVDFSDPSLPPGVDADTIRRGIVLCQDDLRSAGHQIQHMFIPPDPMQLQSLSITLAKRVFECVVIGGGVRIPPRNLHLFERVINIVAGAPSVPAIALVNRPEEAASAVARALSDESAAT